MVTSGPRPGDEEYLPSPVIVLAPRMRQISEIVYKSSGATLAEIHEQVGEDITIFGLRTLLSRLVARGIVARRPSGRHRAVLYLPAILTAPVRAAALEKLVDNCFDGSVEDALQTALQLMNAKDH